MWARANSPRVCPLDGVVATVTSCCGVLSSRTFSKREPKISLLAPVKFLGVIVIGLASCVYLSLWPGLGHLIQLHRQG